MTDNIKKFPKKGTTLPDNIQHTESFVMQDVFYTDQPMKIVNDLVNGGTRHRRWGMTVSFAAIPGFDQIPPGSGPTLLPKSPTRFFTADSLPELRDRIIYELDKALAMVKMAVDDPEEFRRQYIENMMEEMPTEETQQAP